jgi:hypothetical protein
MHLAPSRVIVCCILISITVGCATAPRAVLPPGWPANWSDRHLFYTHSMLVYARDGSSADRAAEHLLDLDNEFQRRTGAVPTPGLLIVNDIADSRIGNLKLDQVLRNAKETVDSDAKRKKELAKIGIPMEEFALSLTIPVTKEQLTSQGEFTPIGLQQIQWSAATPTEARADRFDRNLLDAGLKHANLNFFQQMLILPFMPLIRSILDDAMHAQRDAVLYECICNAQPGWSDARKKSEREAYQKERMGEVVKSLKAATQEVGASTKP